MLMRLGGRVTITGKGPALLVLVGTTVLPRAARRGRALLVTDDILPSPDQLLGHSAVLCARPLDTGEIPFVLLPDWITYLGDGDVLRIDPSNQQIRVLYRHGSMHNALLVTERCNSDCIMCSQPPKAAADDHVVQELIKLVQLLPETKAPIGITGGEPFLAGQGILELLTAIRLNHPNAPVQLLTNGRMFSYLKLAVQTMQAIGKQAIFGIPLYSSDPQRHDFIVQAEGAFDQTVRGIMNAKRVGLRIQLRVVLHKYTVSELEWFSEFLLRNLPMIDQVAFMGLESTGYTRLHPSLLWVDPVDYAEALAACVLRLNKRSIHAVIFNLPLCVLPESVWRYSAQSISDWKNEYAEECDSCDFKGECAGFFSSGLALRTRSVRPMKKPGVTHSAV